MPDDYRSIDELAAHPICERMKWGRTQIEALVALSLVTFTKIRKEGNGFCIEFESFRSAVKRVCELRHEQIPDPEDIDKIQDVIGKSKKEALDKRKKDE